jgi:hypothetical protein
VDKTRLCARMVLRVYSRLFGGSRGVCEHIDYTPPLLRIPEFSLLFLVSLVLFSIVRSPDLFLL